MTVKSVSNFLYSSKLILNQPVEYWYIHILNAETQAELTTGRKKKQKNKHSVDGEMTHLVNYMPPKLKDLSLDSQLGYPKPDVICTCTPRSEKAETRGS